MLIDLKDEEREALVGLVEREIGELGPEIRHTDSRSYRDGLKHRKQVMCELREHLLKSQAASA